MTRRLPSRRPAPRAVAAPAGRQPLWRWPLALIFRRGREAPPIQPVTYKGADEIRVTLAPRLQLALHFAIHLDSAHHEHRAMHINAARISPAPLTQLFRSRHLHFHAAREPEPAARMPTDARDLPARREAPREHGEEALQVRRSARTTRSPARPRPSAPAIPLASEPAARQLRRARAPTARPAEQASHQPGATLTPPRRTASATAIRPSSQAPARLAIARPAALTRLPHRAPVAERRLAPPAPSDRPERATAAVPVGRAIPAAPMDLAVRSGRRSDDVAEGSRARSQRRRVSAPPLEFRRSSAPAAAPQPAAEPRAAAQPAAPAIDVDALSRDVISRIEKRLRIERERHGRI